MDPIAAIDELESAGGHPAARRILIAAKNTPGLSRAFADRVVQRLGESHQEARQLARKWPLVLRYGDEPASAIRVEAIVERLAGRWERSAEAFQRAGKAAKDPIQRLSLQMGAVDGLARAGRVKDAVRLGDRLARSLRKLGAEDQAARVETNVGNALLWIDSYEAARVRLSRALPELDRAGLSTEAAVAGLSLSTAEIYGGDPAHGQEHAESARAAFTKLGLSHYAELCEVNLAQAALMRGRADEALDLLLALRRNLDAHPAEKGRILEFLGDAYLRLNLYEEAISSYREALRATSSGAPLNRANCRLGIGTAAAELGDVRLARRSLTAAEVGFRTLGTWCGLLTPRSPWPALKQGLGISTEPSFGPGTRNASYARRDPITALGPDSFPHPLVSAMACIEPSRSPADTALAISSGRCIGSEPDVAVHASWRSIAACWNASSKQGC